MRLPFGLDAKSVIVTIILMYLVLPWVLRMVSAKRSNSGTAATR